MSISPDDLIFRHLARVVESSDDAIVSKDLNGNIRSWNHAAERLFGYTAEEAVGRSIRMIIPTDRQSEEDTVLSHIREGKSVTHYETIRQHKDGTLIPISLTVSPIRDESGVVVGASKIARDISERTRLAALAKEHAADAATLAGVGAAIAATLDRDTIVQKVTDAGTELTHAEFGAFFYNVRTQDAGDAYMLYALSGAPKEAFAKFPHPRATAVFAPTFHGRGTVRLEDVTQDLRYGKNPPYMGMPEGHLPVRSYLAVSVKSATGEVLGGLFFGHREAGQFTEQHQRLAEGIAAWASVALENSHLYIEAQNANRLKDEFLAVLSHELRTPLSAIVGYVRLLRGHLLYGDDADRGLEALDRNANALTQIVNDVLDVSGIVSGKIRLNVQPVDLATIVDAGIGTVRPAADAKGVRLVAIVDPRVGRVAGDPDRLQQVVWNLLTNAIKFTPKGGQVQIRLEQVNSHVEFVVSDTGVGIRPDFLPFVFERFRQADSGLNRKTGGLGLGLAIVRHLIEMHGGTVEASSAGEGEGATFCVRLPRMIVQSEKSQPPREHPRTEQLRPLPRLTGLQGVRIVAVDDEADALIFLRVVLEAAGAEVSAIGSPLAALAQIEAVRPDVLLFDLGMPELDGYELIARVRASSNPAVRDIPAAALTAFARAEDRTRALDSGFEMHLAKPVDPAELVASLAVLVRRARRGR
jgi:PAS domain S-box-containing protein